MNLLLDETLINWFNPLLDNCPVVFSNYMESFDNQKEIE